MLCYLCAVEVLGSCSLATQVKGTRSYHVSSLYSLMEKANGEGTSPGTSISDMNCC